VDDGITYLCMADEESGKRIPFAFLEDIKNRFRATYGDRGKTAIAYGMNTDFSRVLQNQMVCSLYILLFFAILHKLLHIQNNFHNSKLQPLIVI
jgi:hypothetical protein